ncbi:25c3272f-ea55-43c8-afeb-d6a2c70af367 [Thermothielavioides terrestris]|uniref:25c3272f-ea55-43c8-afeb-d6a2c70af367 n=1 Tax=Thermothielavioides terrestris TaxID=2587410 RepID=A0A3S4ESE2_9PEZI|nr:25c3272f-ea55-43c8-afeb-d6a2c70af367 [Thermothielavioides terrestris]
MPEIYGLLVKERPGREMRPNQTLTPPLRMQLKLDKTNEIWRHYYKDRVRARVKLQTYGKAPHFPKDKTEHLAGTRKVMGQNFQHHGETHQSVEFVFDDLAIKEPGYYELVIQLERQHSDKTWSPVPPKTYSGGIFVKKPKDGNKH